MLFISGGEIFVILLAILIFFGADKIPEFARMMGKGVREFKKATDDIKRELNENTSGVMNDIKSIREDVTNTLTKEISEPMEKTVNETAGALEEYKNTYNPDYYYNNQDYNIGGNNEYQAEMKSDDKKGLAETTADASENQSVGESENTAAKTTDA